MSLNTRDISFSTMIIYIVISNIVLLEYGASELRADPKNQAVVIRHNINGKLITTYYSSLLTSIYQQDGANVTLFDLKNQQVYWFEHQNPKVVRYLDFSDLNESEAHVQKLSQQILGFPGDSEASMPNFDWSIHRLGHSLSRQNHHDCQAVTLKDNKNTEVSMCVVSDARVSPLIFLDRYYNNIPQRLLLNLDSTAEIFLYRHGLVPLYGSRRGRSFEVVDVRLENVGSKFFQPPDVLDYRRGYGQQSKQSFRKSVEKGLQQLKSLQ